MQSLVVVELQTHAIMHFIISQGDVILVDRIPFLNADFLWTSTSLCRDKFLQVPNRIILIALHTHFLSQPIVTDNLNHRCHRAKGPGANSQGSQKKVLRTEQPVPNPEPGYMKPLRFFEVI